MIDANIRLVWNCFGVILCPRQTQQMNCSKVNDLIHIYIHTYILQVRRNAEEGLVEFNRVEYTAPGRPNSRAKYTELTFEADFINFIIFKTVF